MPETEVILVDPQDREIGRMEKVAAHAGKGILHRAFSVFVVRSDSAILLQRRAAGKMLWPLFWANSCCSHPAPGETVADAARRRLREELRIDVASCDPLYAFEYHASFGDVGSEHELCHVVRAQCDADPNPDPAEVAETAWLNRAEIIRRLEGRPGDFSPWFKLEWAHLLANFPDFDRPLAPVPTERTDGC